MGLLNELAIVKAEDGQAATIFENLFPSFIADKNCLVRVAGGQF